MQQIPSRLMSVSLDWTNIIHKNQLAFSAFTHFYIWPLIESPLMYIRHITFGQQKSRFAIIVLVNTLTPYLWRRGTIVIKIEIIQSFSWCFKMSWRSGDACHRGVYLACATVDSYAQQERVCYKKWGNHWNELDNKINSFDHNDYS